MKVALLLVALTIALVAADTTLTEAEYQRSFTEWMHSNTKMYESHEFQFRFDAFRANTDFINKWDSAAMGFEVEANKFADMTIQEFRRLYLGTRVTVPTLSTKAIDTPVAATADSVDWRAKGYVNPIKDQGQCGSCWAFSTTGSTEGAVFKKTNKLESFSEQQLVDCSASFGNQGCNGGLMDNGFKYIIKNGITLEDNYPYTAKDGKCQDKPAVGHLTSYKDVGKTEAALATALSTVGPISVAIDASHSSFQLYKSGTYYEPRCSSSQLDHGVLAVGYTDDSYIVKNSWGTTWGQQGYINMSRGKNNNCGIASMASYPIA